MANRYSAPRDQEEFNAWFSSLAKHLRSSDEVEACGAALTIMQSAFEGVAIEVPGLIDGLLNLLQASRPTRFAAAWALGWLSRGSPMGTVRAPVWQPKSGEVPSLIKAFESVDEMETDTLRWLAVSLGLSKDLRAVKPLVNRLGNPDPALQTSVIEALGEVGRQDIADRLITELGNTNAGVRLALVEALGKLGGREVAGALVSKLDDPDTMVRRAVVEALGKLGGEGGRWSAHSQAGGPFYRARSRSPRPEQVRRTGGSSRPRRQAGRPPCRNSRFGCWNARRARRCTRLRRARPVPA